MGLPKNDNNLQSMQLIECPRDAMQGWARFIPTEKKAAYLNSLLAVGFDTLDFGSFVSARAIPQLEDTSEVIQKLNLKHTKTKLLAIVANTRGAQEAAAYEEIDYLGFPFSISETFQQLNTHRSIAVSLDTVAEIQHICLQKNKSLVIYLSMGFGNPYGDQWSEEIVFHWANHIAGMGVQIISLADTVGLASPGQVFSVTSYLINQLPGHRFGVHLHSSPQDWKPKIDAALSAGCRRFDGALKGIGGCPLANNELVGNINSELMMAYFQQLNLLPPIDQDALVKSIQLAEEIFV
jgi:hydroxymethylglutaryl-CoA lyase